jgi:hypothetical protein
MTKTVLVILSEILQGIHEVKHIATALKELEDAKPSRIPEEAIQEPNISGEDAEEMDKTTAQELATFIEECEQVEELAQGLIMTAVNISGFFCTHVSKSVEAENDL